MRLGAGSDVTANNIDVSTGIAEPWAALRENAEFRMLFADHAHRGLLNGGPLTPEAGRARFGALADQIEPAIISESARWGDMKSDAPHDLEDWYPWRDYVIDTYLPERTTIVLRPVS